MKLSDAMQAGWDKVGKQCTGVMCEGPHRAPSAVCALGAATLGLVGDAFYIGDLQLFDEARKAYVTKYGSPVSLDNDNGLSIPEIIERLRAIGH